MQGVTLLVSGYVFLASLAAPGVLLASDESPIPGEQPAATPPSETTGPAAPTDEGKPAAGVKEPGDEGPSAAVPGSSTLEAAPVAEPGRARAGGGHGSQAAATTTVAMRDIEFRPHKIKIAVGDTVRWENEDNVEHDALGEDGSFETPIIDGGESSQHTFNKGGEFPYFCSIHQGMTGKIQVGSSSGGGGGGGGG